MQKKSYVIASYCKCGYLGLSESIPFQDSCPKCKSQLIGKVENFYEFLKTIEEKKSRELEKHAQQMKLDEPLMASLSIILGKAIDILEKENKILAQPGRTVERIENEKILQEYRKELINNIDMFLEDLEKEKEKMIKELEDLMALGDIRPEQTAGAFYDYIMFLRERYAQAKVKSQVITSEGKIIDRIKRDLNEQIDSISRDAKKAYFSGYISEGLLRKYQSYYLSKKDPSKADPKESSEESLKEVFPEDNRDHFFPRELSTKFLLEINKLRFTDFLILFKNIIGSVIYVTKDENQKILKVSEEKKERWEKSKEFILLNNYKDNVVIKSIEYKQWDRISKIKDLNNIPEKLDIIGKRLEDATNYIEKFRKDIDKILETCETYGFKL